MVDVTMECEIGSKASVDNITLKESSSVGMKTERISMALMSHSTLDNWKRPTLKVKIPCMPVDSEYLTDYFQTFERLAMAYDWKQESLVPYLLPYLNEHGLCIHACLVDEDAMKYDILKNAILESYRLMEDNYHLSFVHSYHAVNENFKDYASHVEKNFNRWIVSTSVQKTYTKLKQLMILDKFYQGIPGELRALLKDLRLDNLKDVSHVADNMNMV